MALPRQDVVDGIAQGLARFEEVLRSLSDEEWQAQTRCEGWSVADTAAHVVGTMTAIAEGRAAELLQPDNPQAQADERRGKTQHELADELNKAAKIGNDIVAAIDETAWVGPPIVDIPGTLGQAVEGLWYDAYVHIEDINAAIGRPAERGPGLKAAVSHLADLLTLREWGNATLALDGMPEFAVGDGSGPRVTGDPLDFVLIATGRQDPAVLGLDETVNIYAPA